jgi:hypothetical protein
MERAGIMAIETRGTQVEQLTARVRGPVVVPGDAIGRSCTVVAHLMQSDLLLPEEERRAAIAEVHLRIPPECWLEAARRLDVADGQP